VTLDFYYEFASTYSYLSVARVEAVADEASVAIRWKPFLLGPIFRAQGLETSPFNAFPEKGRYMWRDVARVADSLGLPPLVRPPQFPQNGLLAARVAISLPDETRPAFTRAAFHAQFAEGRDIASERVIATILRGLGRDPAADFEAALTDANKGRLRAQTDEAKERGVFGAPSFVTESGELFWGNDRLEAALAWSKLDAPR
jgi:2-hydroxychromene-2-carboxylate isomerase